MNLKTCKHCHWWNGNVNDKLALCKSPDILLYQEALENGHYKDNLPSNAAVIVAEKIIGLDTLRDFGCVNWKANAIITTFNLLKDESCLTQS